MQAPRGLLKLRCPQHDSARLTSARAGDPHAPQPSVGLDLPEPAPYLPRLLPSGAHRRARRLHRHAPLSLSAPLPPARAHTPELYDVDHLNAYYAPRYPHDLRRDHLNPAPHRRADPLPSLPRDHHRWSARRVGVSLQITTTRTTRAPRSPVTQAHFLPASHLDHDDLKDILVLYEHRLTRRFIRRGYLRPLTPGLPVSEQSFALHWGHEPPSEEDAQLLKCYAACTKLRHAFGPRAGQPLELNQGDAPLPQRGAARSASLTQVSIFMPIR